MDSNNEDSYSKPSESLECKEMSEKKENNHSNFKKAEFNMNNANFLFVVSGLFFTAGAATLGTITNKDSINTEILLSINTHEILVIALFVSLFIGIGTLFLGFTRYFVGRYFYKEYSKPEGYTFDHSYYDAVSNMFGTFIFGPFNMIALILLIYGVANFFVFQSFSIWLLASLGAYLGLYIIAFSKAHASTEMQGEFKYKDIKWVEINEKHKKEYGNYIGLRSIFLLLSMVLIPIPFIRFLCHLLSKFKSP